MYIYIYIYMYMYTYVYTGLETDGVTSQNVNHFGVIANHLGKVNRKIANHF